MWQVKIWKFKTQKGSELQLARSRAWLARHERKIQYQQVFVDNAWCIEYRKLRRVY